MPKAFESGRARWWRAVERHPLALTFGLMLLSAPLVLMLVGWQTNRWADAKIRSSVEEVAGLLEVRQSQAMLDFEFSLSQFKGLPQLLATEPKLLRALEQPGKPANIAAANNFLRDVSALLLVDLAWLLDSSGTSLATSNYATTQSLIGVAFADRDYFKQAINGRPGYQFAIGRQTDIPGLFFSYPVRAASGDILGVVAIKNDLPNIARRIRLNGLFVADDQGVVILAERKELLFHVLPGAPVTSMDPKLREQKYKRTEFPLFKLVSANRPQYPEIQLLGDQRTPVLHRTFQIGQEGLTAHMVQEVDLDVNQRLFFTSTLIAVMAALWGLYATLVFILRARMYRHRIEAANGELLRLNEQLKQQAESDFLTGCMNRRRFDDQLKQEISRCQRQHYALSVAVLDLDRFKGINDAHGHITGDAVLQHFARLVQDNIRLIDSFARLGGEEFAVLMPDTDKRAALPLIERLRALVASTPMTLEDGSSLTITVSIGITRLCPGDNAITFIRRADRALYAAKEAGRNRAIYAPCPESASGAEAASGAAQPVA